MLGTLFDFILKTNPSKVTVIGYFAYCSGIFNKY